MKNIKMINNIINGRGEEMNLKSVKIVLIILFLIFFLNFVGAQQTFDQYKPYIHNPSVGDLPKLETFGEYRTELFPGAGTYVYEIEVPRGTVGLKPSLTLLYNSQSVLQRPGLLGSGWSLTENSITRDVNNTI